MKADHGKVKRKLSIAKGQIEGIIKMIDEDAYCIDVSNQLLATIALLKSANEMVIAEHLRHCVKEAKNEEEIDEKIEEVEKLIKRMSN